MLTREEANIIICAIENAICRGDPSSEKDIHFQRAKDAVLQFVDDQPLTWKDDHEGRIQNLEKKLSIPEYDATEVVKLRHDFERLSYWMQALERSIMDIKGMMLAVSAARASTPDYLTKHKPQREEI